MSTNSDFNILTFILINTASSSLRINSKNEKSCETKHLNNVNWGENAPGASRNLALQTILRKRRTVL